MYYNPKPDLHRSRHLKLELSHGYLSRLFVDWVDAYALVLTIYLMRIIWWNEFTIEQTPPLFFLSSRYQFSHKVTSALTLKMILNFNRVNMTFGDKDLFQHSQS